MEYKTEVKTQQFSDPLSLLEGSRVHSPGGARNASRFLTTSNSFAHE